LFEVDLLDRDGMFSKEASPPRWDVKRGFFIAIFWMALFAALLFFVGFLIAIPVCVFSYIRFFGKKSWAVSLMVTASVWIFVYGLFNGLMNFDLFEGIFFGGIY
jgi:hypothetical protein